jgi:alkylhydroperoxidase family enzyme
MLEGKVDGFLNTTGDLLGVDEAILWWNDRYYTQPDLAWFALDILAVPPMSDDCERLFSGASILLDKRCRRLGMDILEANECLRYSFPTVINAYYDTELAYAHGTPTSSSPQYSTLREQAEARLAASLAAEGPYHVDNDVSAEQQHQQVDEEAIMRDYW